MALCVDHAQKHLPHAHAISLQEVAPRPGGFILREDALAAIPTNWLDSLLTGPDAALRAGYSYNGDDIERLLRAVRDRIAALSVSPSSPQPKAVE